MATEIVKADGTVEIFDGSKLENSLIRAGATESIASRIRSTIEDSISPMAESTEIYRRAFQMLRHDSRPSAARYSLRRALFELGPTGHPFEDFVAEIFKKEGWEVEGRRIIPGKCVSHEVDVYAKREGEHLAAELKYHNNPGYKTDVKVALYVKARFDDIWQCDPSIGSVCPVDTGFLITNTKFTRQAIEYANCSGMKLLGWSYPHEGNLYDRIIANGLYPVTSLTLLKKAEKKLLIDRSIVTCEQVRENRSVLREIGMTPERIGAVVAEINVLCSHK
ncbi:restriction endonuclease [Patescibacteria group bacterium]|nr:restriction endonuclease [Patescibacteria group bacterium]MBU1500908.1 restriction endonuclease [Patescibacteria group bacterium]MBU2080963.1 restriction endonuclease [Patescibacteria group bacterium]MBU2124068.1 restriction endonuclease [Patescibacteria group bacterium]MBU2194641.1 restriction endonuclease [Patescibacteria group bacterium]